jgi:hypothetical protein
MECSRYRQIPGEKFRAFASKHVRISDSQSRDSWRYRPSLTFEKDISKKIISGAKLYITEEVFYDSLLKRFSRNRFTVGVNKTLTNQLSLDLYYMRQNDGTTRPGDLHVIGTSWKIKL